MASQIIILRKGLGALLALKWLFTSVPSIMALQIRMVSKGFGALHALKWLFSNAHPNMALQMASQMGNISKLFRAKLALIWHFSLVLLSVAEHLGMRHGRMLALRLFITMGSQVAHN
uniref:Uncharacterized protein n=1 Tax=Ixodes ricinus TaxID=34613 RepID=A0A147BRT8_IXORI